MASKSHLTYETRAIQHSDPMVKKLFELAETKRSNVIVSADLRNTKDLLDLADCKPCLAESMLYITDRGRSRTAHRTFQDPYRHCY